MASSEGPPFQPYLRPPNLKSTAARHINSVTDPLIQGGSLGQLPLPKHQWHPTQRSTFDIILTFLNSEAYRNIETEIKKCKNTLYSV